MKRPNMAASFALANIPRVAAWSCAAMWLSARLHEEAMETARQGSAFWTHWLGEFGFFEALRMKGQEGSVPKTFEQMVKSGFQIVGTPDKVGEEIGRLKEALDVEYIIFVMYGGITEHRRMLESIPLFGEKVIPHFPDAETPEPERVYAKVAATVNG